MVLLKQPLQPTMSNKNTANVLPPIWRVSDDLWQRIERLLLALDPPAQTGRPRIDPRAALDAMIYRGRSGLQWNQLPKSFPDGSPFPDDSSVHRTMQRWAEKGVFERIWHLLVEECDALGDVCFEWQAADTAMGKPASVETR